MLEPILSGIIFGLLLAVLVGPVFFALIQASIEKGFRAGMFLAAGVLCSDALYIAVAYLGTHQLAESDNFRYWVGLLGAFLLIAFGISSFLKKPAQQQITSIQNHSRRRSVLKGFLLNTMNPFVFLFWLGAVGMVSLKENYTDMTAFAFFAATLCTAFSSDVLKAFIAHRIKKYLTPVFVLWMNRISGIALVVFGIRLLLKVW